MENLTKTLEADISTSYLDEISKSKIVAMDCETGGLYPLRDRLYLVQLAGVSGEIKVIRATDWKLAKNLKSLLLDENITKVFHFAIMDCAFLMNYLETPVIAAYCTKIASKIARTYSSSHSLSSLIKEFFNITLDKNLQTSYWGSGNISSAQIEYAATDVKYLLQVRNNLEAILVEKGLLPSGITFSELNQKCQSMIPLLTHLWVNGWDFGKEDPNTIFGK